MIANLVLETRTLLSRHRDFLLALSQQLAEKGSLEAKDVAAIAKDFGLNATIREEGYLHLPGYGGMMS